MFLCLLEFFQALVGVYCSRCHVLIERLNFLALVGSLHSDVLGDHVDVIHNAFNFVQIVASLVNDLIHVVHLIYDFDSAGLSIVTALGAVVVT